MEQSFVRFQQRRKADIWIGASVPAESLEMILVSFAFVGFMREV